MSYYECLHCLPEGSDSPSRSALAARRLGYDGIIICNHTGFENVFRPEAARNIEHIDVAFGVEVVASGPKVLRSRISALRSKVDFLIVHGGPEEINRAACEDPNVDVLLHSEDGGLSIAAARAAQLNQVAIGFELRRMICQRGISRWRWLQALQKTLALARKFELSMVITAGGRSHLDLRAPREIMALAEVAGFEEEEAEEALREPGRILGLNRRRWVGPGVEIL
jgi:ribonuclease P/MRP protein subunit RPP1